MSELEKLRLGKLQKLQTPKQPTSTPIPQFRFDPANPMIQMGAIVPAQMLARDYFQQHPSLEYLKSLRYVLQQEISRREASSASKTR